MLTWGAHLQNVSNQHDLWLALKAAKGQSNNSLRWVRRFRQHWLLSRKRGEGFRACGRGKKNLELCESLDENREPAGEAKSGQRDVDKCNNLLGSTRDYWQGPVDFNHESRFFALLPVEEAARWDMRLRGGGYRNDRSSGGRVSERYGHRQRHVPTSFIRRARPWLGRAANMITRWHRGWVRLSEPVSKAQRRSLACHAWKYTFCRTTRLPNTTREPGLGESTTPGAPSRTGSLRAG